MNATNRHKTADQDSIMRKISSKSDPVGGLYLIFKEIL